MTSLVEIYRRFPSREAAIAHLEAVRWPNGPECPYCGWRGVSHNRDSTRELTASRWKCQKCLRSFSATVGTIFHNSHIDLQRWFLLISLMLNAKNGLSAMQAARDLDMRRPTVWSMIHRVRKALVDDGKLLAELVGMDEAFVGGKPRNPLECTIPKMKTFRWQAEDIWARVPGATGGYVLVDSDGVRWAYLIGRTGGRHHGSIIAPGMPVSPDLPDFARVAEWVEANFSKHHPGLGDVRFDAFTSQKKTKVKRGEMG